MQLNHRFKSILFINGNNFEPSREMAFKNTNNFIHRNELLKQIENYLDDYKNNKHFKTKPSF